MLDTMLRRFERRRPGQSVLTARLLDAMALPGCPLCRVAGLATRHHLETLLDERVTLPEAHRRLLSSRGFCTAHTWALPAAALAAQSARGVALLYVPLLNDLLRHWLDPARRRRWFAPERPCPVCQTVDRTEPAYRAELLILLRGGQPVPPLCGPHLRAIAPHASAEVRAQLAAARDRAGGTAAERLALLVGARPPHLFDREPDCPACAAGAAAARAVGPARGLCREHAWAIFATTGAASLGALAGSPHGTADCPACQAAHTAAAGALTRPQAAHRLCLAHLRRYLERPAPEARMAGEIAFWSLIQLQRDLVRFVDAGRADFVGALTAAEQRSWLVALGRFGGEQPGAGVTPAGIAAASRRLSLRRAATAERWWAA